MRRRGSNGNLVAPPQWEDERFDFTGRRIDISAGRIDYNYAELGIDFQDNALYPTDLIGIIDQMHHRWKLESEIRPHLHWMQSGANLPNWLLRYRIYRNGDSPPAWTNAAYTSNLFTYTAGTILQIAEFPAIDMTGIDTVSAFVDFKMYRDTTNASGLFAGADPLVGDALSKEFDIHYQVDSSGSTAEYDK